MNASTAELQCWFHSARPEHLKTTLRLHICLYVAAQIDSKLTVRKTNDLEPIAPDSSFHHGS